MNNMTGLAPSSRGSVDALAHILSRRAVVGVIGLGYVGLPLLAARATAGFRSISFDIDSTKPERISASLAYIDAVSSTQLTALVRDGTLTATTVFELLDQCDVVLICVPTPLTRHREPDLTFETTARVVATRLKSGQTIILESTKVSGNDAGSGKPILEATGLESGRDFLLGTSR